MQELTKTQQLVLDYVANYQTTNGFSPSLKDICQHFGFASVSTAKFHLDNLAKKQVITRIGHRAIRIEGN